jgi:hypothetical protein
MLLIWVPLEPSQASADIVATAALLTAALIDYT